MVHGRATRPPRGRIGRRPTEDADGFEIVAGGPVEFAGPAQEAWIQMRELSHSPRMLEAGGKLAQKLGLSPAALRALRPLATAGPMTMGHLAAQLRCDGSYVTGLIDALERAGLAVRQNDASDRRVKVVALTDKGSKAARRACELINSPPESFSALSSDEVDQLVVLLRKIRSAEAAE